MQRKSIIFKKHFFYTRFLGLFVVAALCVGVLGCCDNKAHKNTSNTETATCCGGKPQENLGSAGAKTGTQAASARKKQVEEAKEIALMISPQGLNDRSFNDSAYRGLKKAEERFNIKTTIIEPSTWQDPEQSLRFFAKQRFDIIIVVGLGFMDAVNHIAKENPQLQFCIIDSDVSEGNVRGVAFREEEGAFLCGYLGGKATKTNKLAFVGGVNIPVIERFKSGFETGLRLANPEAELAVEYIAEDFSGFNNVEAAANIANQLYEDGCDIIFPAAGASVQGIMASAKGHKKYVFGVDNNQDALAPGLVLTSLLKRVDRVVESIVETVCQETTESIKSSYGLADGALGLTDFEFTRELLGEQLIAELETLKIQIINGEISPLKE